MRRALIGVIVAIFGIAAVLDVGYAAGAKSAKGHHGQCASKTSKAKAKHAKRRAKCKKARKTDGRSKGPKTVKPTTKTPPLSTTPPGTGTTGTATGTARTAEPPGTTGTGTTTGPGTTTTTGPGTATTTTTGTTGTTTRGTALSQCPSGEVRGAHYSALIIHVLQGGHEEEHKTITILGLYGDQEGSASRGVWCLLPGSYEVRVSRGPHIVGHAPGNTSETTSTEVLVSKTVTISEPQELEVTLELPAEPGATLPPAA